MKRRKPKLRAHAARVRSVDEYYALPYDEQLRRQKALKALSLMRTQGLSRTRAAKEIGISPASLQRIAGKAIVKDGSRYRAAKSDRLLRVMVVPAPGGKLEVGIRSAREATLISEYDNAVRRYVYTGDPSDLARFKGRSITVNGEKIEFLTDLRQLDRLAHAGELSFESIYARVA
jgi:hypothetical protein